MNTMDRPRERNVRESLVAMRRAALADPNPGDVPLTDRRHVWDTVGLTEPDRPTRVILTIDVGYHVSGFLPNSDFEKCWHLSVSHPSKLDGPSREPEAPTREEVWAWAVACFGEREARTYAHVEPPIQSSLDNLVTEHGRMPGVAHVRIWLDEFNRPLLTLGEPYHVRLADWSPPEADR